MLITIKSVAVKTAKDGREFKTVTTTGGKRMTMFSTGYGDKPIPGYDLVVDGATIDTGTKEEGKYTNIVSATEAPEGTTPVPTDTSEQDAYDRRAAAKLVSTMIASGWSETPTDVVELMWSWVRETLGKSGKAPSAPSEGQREPSKAGVQEAGIEKAKELFKKIGCNTPNKVTEFLSNAGFKASKLEELSGDDLNKLLGRLTGVIEEIADEPF